MNPISLLQKEKVLPLVTFKEIEHVAPLCQTLVSAGLNCIEIAYRSELATEAISIASKQKDLLVGAGTVITPDQAMEAINAGAQLIIAPGLNSDVINYCKEKGIPVIPGVCTPTEITNAIGHGLEYLKFFPSESFGGIKTLKAIGGPFPNIQFMPAGGINPSNFMDYLSLSQVFCCSGSWMVKPEHIETQDFEQIKKNCIQILQSINEEA